MALYCGTTVLAALTGETATSVDEYLTDVMGVDHEATGTTAMDLVWAFREFGYTMTNVASYDAPYSGPKLARWLAAIEPTWRRQHPLVVAVEARDRLGHWVTCWGRCVLDSLSDGLWVPLDGSGLGQRYVASRQPHGSAGRW
jgi:hypothetical protein